MGSKTEHLSRNSTRAKLSRASWGLAPLQRLFLQADIMPTSSSSSLLAPKGAQAPLATAGGVQRELPPANPTVSTACWGAFSATPLLTLFEGSQNDPLVLLGTSQPSLGIAPCGTGTGSSGIEQPQPTGEHCPGIQLDPSHPTASLSPWHGRTPSPGTFNDVFSGKASLRLSSAREEQEHGWEMPEVPTAREH